MDSFSKDDTEREDKQQALNLRKGDLLSIEGSQDQTQAHFAVDEPLDVQLRFDLGSLVDTHGLLDTQEPRDSHWDFVRHDQGPEREAALLEHVKHDDDCESWPATSSQMDAQLFIDPQDDINEITDAFATKGKNVNSLVESESCSLSRQYEQHVDTTSWVDGKQSQKMGEMHPNESKQNKETENVSVAASMKEDENINERTPTSLIHESKESPTEDASETQIECRSESKIQVNSVKGPDRQEDPEITAVQEVDAVQGVLHNNGESTSTVNNTCLDTKLGIDPELELQSSRSYSEIKDETLEKMTPAIAESEIQLPLYPTVVTENTEVLTDSSVGHVTASSQAKPVSETHLLNRDEQVEETDKALESQGKATMADSDSRVGKEMQVMLLSGSSKDATTHNGSKDMNSYLKPGPGNIVTIGNSKPARAEGLKSCIHENDSNTDSMLTVHHVVAVSDLIDKEGSKSSVPLNGHVFSTITSDDSNSHSELMEGNRNVIEPQSQSAMTSDGNRKEMKCLIVVKETSVSATPHSCEKEEDSSKQDGQTTGYVLPALLEDKTVGISTSGDVSVGICATPKGGSYTSQQVMVGSKSTSEVLQEEKFGSFSDKVATMVENSSVGFSVTDNQYASKWFNAATVTETSNEFTTNSKSQLEIAPGRDQGDDSNECIMHSTAKVNDLTKFRTGNPRNQKEAQENKNQECEDVQVSTQICSTAIEKFSGGDQRLVPDGQVMSTDKLMKQSGTTEHSSELPSVVDVSTTTTDVLSVLASTTASDVISSEVKVSRRKSDKSARNNKPKDNVQTTPPQIRLDKEPKSSKKGGSGRQNGSPSKSGSKNATSQRKRKGTSSMVFQDSSNSVQGTDGLQNNPNANKAVTSINSRQHQHHHLPDLNVAEVMGSTQPFNEQQQVQLRAQILVYGSLIQGAAPEEALMIAAFSVIRGVSREARSDLEGSGRAVWEKTWQAAVERIEKKISGSTPKCASQSTGALTAFPSSVTSVRMIDASKVNCSIGTSVLEPRNASVLNSAPSEIQDRSSNKSGKSGGHSNLNSPIAVHTISCLSGETHGNQSRSSKIPSGVLPMPSASTTVAIHPASSPVSGTFAGQPSKAHTDLPQAISRTYFPTPSSSHFLPGASQWVPSPFPAPAPWASQTQSTLYNSPSVLSVHPQSLINPNQALENRKAVSLPSFSVPVDPIHATITTTVSGSSSLAADPAHTKQAKTESRPRKRKKPDSEQPDSPLNVMSSSCTAFGATQNSSQVSVATTNPFTFSEPLAMVVAEAHASSNSVRSLVAPFVDNIPVAHKVDIPSTCEVALSKSLSFQDSIANLEQAKVYAEEATSAADSSVRETASLWNQLKSQSNSGIISEIEMQLASSVLAASTAASVAKAAAAAARAAYEASRHAKMIGEKALSSRNQENRLQNVGHLQDSADLSVFEAWKMPDNCKSIISSAKVASEKRLEAASIAIMNAHNLSLVVKAAELAANAVSQVGAIMTMGESVPFTLDALMESGPEGIEKLLLHGPLHAKETPSLKAPGTEIPGKNNEVSERKECSSVKINQSNVQMELEGTTLLIRDGLTPRDTQNSEQVVYDDDHNAENHIIENSIVEVLHAEKGIRTVWFSAKVQKVEGQRMLVVYDRLLSEDGTNQLEDWVDQGDSINNVPKVRLAHSGINIRFAGTRKRRREAIGNYKCSVGDHVDAFLHDGWCEGEVKEVVEDGETKVKVHFPDGDTSLIKASMLRPSLVWRDGQWIMWTDIKKQENHLPFVGIEETQKVDTPTPKRQKLEKPDVEPDSALKQVLDANAIDDCTRVDTTSSRMQVGGEITTLENVDNRSSEPISKVIIGVPRSTKRRKFMDVSEHYVSSKASRVFLGVKENKELSIVPLQFHIGSAGPSKEDSTKSRKTLYSTQKTRQHKGQDVAAKAQFKSKSQVDKSSTNGKLKHKEELTSRLKRQENRPVETEKHSEVIVKKDSSISAITTTKTNQTLTSSMHGKSKQYSSRMASQLSSGNEKQDYHMSSVRGRETRSQSMHEVTKDAHVKGRQNENHIVKIDGGCFQSKENHVSLYKESDAQQTNQSMRRKNEPSDKNKDSEKHEKHPNASKDTNKLKEVEKSVPEASELRRTSRKIQPTSKLLEGLQTAPNLGKTGLLHDRGNRKGLTSTTKGPS